MANKCPNCGRNPPRPGENTVLCQECVDSCPMGPRVALQMEETFRMIMADGVKMPHEHPYGKNFR